MVNPVVLFFIQDDFEYLALGVTKRGIEKARQRMAIRKSPLAFSFETQEGSNHPDFFVLPANPDMIQSFTKNGFLMPFADKSVPAVMLEESWLHENWNHPIFTISGYSEMCADCVLDANGIFRAGVYGYGPYAEAVTPIVPLLKKAAARMDMLPDIGPLRKSDSHIDLSILVNPGPGDTAVSVFDDGGNYATLVAVPEKTLERLSLLDKRNFKSLPDDCFIDMLHLNGIAIAVCGKPEETSSWLIKDPVVKNTRNLSKINYDLMLNSGPGYRTDDIGAALNYIRLWPARNMEMEIACVNIDDNGEAMPDIRVYMPLADFVEKMRPKEMATQRPTA